MRPRQPRRASRRIENDQEPMSEEELADEAERARLEALPIEELLAVVESRIGRYCIPAYDFPS